MADLESRFETMVGRMAAVQEASKIQQAALSTLPNRMDVLQQDQRQKHNELSARIDEDLHGMGQELALIKVQLFYWTVGEKKQRRAYREETQADQKVFSTAAFVSGCSFRWHWRASWMLRNTGG